MSLGVTATSTAAFTEDGDLGGGGVLGATHDGAGMTHAAACGSGGSGDETSDGLLAVGLDPAGGLDFGCAADFADHDDALGVGSSLNSLMTSRWLVPLTGSPPMPTQVDWPRSLAGELEDSLVGEGAGAGNDADVALLVNVTGGDADAAAALGLRAGAGSHDSGAVGADQAGRLAAMARFTRIMSRIGMPSVIADGEIEVGVDAFEDGVGREAGRHEDGGDGGAGGGGLRRPQS
jgi:hypothetical protein